jgi:phosphatidylinositol-3-phosphatase
MGHRLGYVVVCAAAVIALASTAALAAPAGTPGVPGSAGSLVQHPCHSGHTAVITHIVVIPFENHSYSAILGRSAPPSYLKTLASKCGTATDFTAIHVPHSLPNYLAVTSGTISGITADCSPSRNCSSPAKSIFGEVGRYHWRLWAESMPTPCSPKNTTLYAPRHAPAVYYTRLAGGECRNDMLPLAGPPSLRRTFTWITPNLLDDMHDGTPAQASTWLANMLAGPGGLLASPQYRSGHTAIFLWFDSGAGNQGVHTPIPLVVLLPGLGHRVVRHHFNDYGLLHGWEGLLRVRCLQLACRDSGFDRAFHLR